MVRLNTNSSVGPRLSTPSLRQTIKQSYILSSLYQELKSRIDPVYKRHPLIVYQMGKVGSETIERSLASYDLGRPMYRVHSLVEENMYLDLRASNVTPREYFKRSRHLFLGKYLAREIARDLHRGHWKVVTMVRDPVAQNISSFFQIADLLIPRFSERTQANALPISELLDVFLQNYAPDGIYVNWFDVEMKPSFDVDVFETPFPTDEGYAVYREPHVDLLLLRLEDVDRCAPAAFREFLGLDDFRVQRKNEAEYKTYHRLYKAFREQAVFPRRYVDGVYGSKYARHFYSDEELAGFRAKLNVGD